MFFQTLVALCFLSVKIVKLLFFMDQNHIQKVFLAKAEKKHR